MRNTEAVSSAKQLEGTKVLLNQPSELTGAQHHVSGDIAASGSAEHQQSLF